jgi:hypothetical protein
VPATDADLNSYADAGDYDGMAMLVDAEGTVADGGDEEAITMGAAGAAGPTPSKHPASPGRRYSSVATFTLTEAATHVGVYVSGTLRRTAPLRTPVGPGTFPIVYGIAVR